MDHLSKTKVLKQLTKTDGESAQAALEKEAEKISLALMEETQFDLLEEQVELLDIIAVRTIDTTLKSATEFLTRAKSLKLTHRDSNSFGAEYIAEYQSTDKLAVKMLEVLSQIRYLDMSGFLSIVVGYSNDEHQNINAVVKSSLESAASYSLMVFHGTESQPGIGCRPQLQILEWLEQQGDENLKDHFGATVTLCRNMLSADMNFMSADYRTISWTSGSIPVTDEIQDVRNRSLAILFKLSDLSEDVEDRAIIIGAVQAATRLPSQSEYGDDHLDMIANDTLAILDFFEANLQGEQHQNIQKIEHDTYWIFRRAFSDEVKFKALAIRDIISKNSEYEIFKTLVGFEGIFDDWDEPSDSSGQYREIEEYRSNKAKEYADSINSNNWDQWRERIFLFAKVKSVDLATFPKFTDFLRYFALASPDRALSLLREYLAQMENFIVPLLDGFWKGSRKDELRSLLLEWIDSGTQLTAIARLFWNSDGFDEDLIKLLFQKAAKDSNRELLIDLIGVATSNYEDDNQKMAESLFISAVGELNKLADQRWILSYWNRQNGNALLEKLEDGDRGIVLESFLNLNRIDFLTEAILERLAKRDPEQIVKLFGQRLKHVREIESEEHYEAIPYKLHGLSKVLSASPRAVTEEVLSWHEAGDPLFRFRGGKFLSIVFPEFSEEFENVLLDLVRSGDKNNISFVIDVLNNYEGEPSVHNLCREIVASPVFGDEFKPGVTIALRSTGVVTGEFGFAEAYARKISEIEDWLHDDRNQVRDFAAGYISSLKEEIEFERRRAEENITLRKHTFGVREDDEKDE